MIARFLGLESRATPENPAFSLQDPAAWDEFLDGPASDSGERVNHRKALRIPALWQGIQMISGDLAKLPLDLMKRIDDDSSERDKSHWAYPLVRRKPNAEMHAFKFWQLMAVHKLLWTNAWAYIDRTASGVGLGLLPLLPDRTGLIRRGGELFCITELSRGPDGTKGSWLQPIPYQNVLHFCGLTLTGMEGMDMVKTMRDSFGRALAAAKFTSRFFKHGAKASGILELPAAMNKMTRDKIEEGFKKTHDGPENWFKTVILRDGAKFHNTSFDPRAGQMNESREEEVREAARALNLQPSRLGISGSVSYNSKAEDKEEYLDTTLSPHLEAITGECWLKLLSPAEQKADSHFFEHNTRALLRMNALQRHQVYAIGIRNAMYSPDECRGFETM